MPIRPYSSVDQAGIRFGNLAASEVFDAGDLIAVGDAGTLTEFPDDDSEAVYSDNTDVEGLLGGVAAEDAHVATVSRGADTIIAYYPWNTGIVFQTSVFSATGGTTAAIPALTDMGEIYQISFQNTLSLGWGLKQTVGVPTTSPCARVINVLDVLGRPITAGDTTTGVSMLFEIITGFSAVD